MATLKETEFKVYADHDGYFRVKLTGLYTNKEGAEKITQILNEILQPYKEKI